jgi:hypothetical protein
MLSFWEVAKVKTTNALVAMSKMKPNSFEYACRVTLLVKKNGNCYLCRNYRPLNFQTRQDSLSMLLIENVLMQLGKA